MKKTSFSLAGLLFALGLALGLLALGLDSTESVSQLHIPLLWSFRWLVLLGAAAILLGAFNLFWQHLQRVRSGETGWLYSLVLIVTMLLVIGGGMTNPDGAHSPFMEWIVDHLIFPGQATLFALLLFFLAVAGFRLLRVTRQGGAWMLAGALLILVIQAPFAADLMPGTMRALTNWFVDVPVMAAVRGALIGASVAMLVAALQYAVGRRS